MFICCVILCDISIDAVMSSHCLILYSVDVGEWDIFKTFEDTNVTHNQQILLPFGALRYNEMKIRFFNSYDGLDTNDGQYRCYFDNIILRDSSDSPSITPTNIPSLTPTITPTNSPTLYPTVNPSLSPTIEPTNNPTNYPTNAPTMNPTEIPSNNPSVFPTPNPVNIFSTLNASEMNNTFTLNTTSIDSETFNETSDSINIQTVLIIVGAVATLVFLIIIIWLVSGAVDVEKNISNISETIIYASEHKPIESPSMYDGVYSPNNNIINNNDTPGYNGGIDPPSIDLSDTKSQNYDDINDLNKISEAPSDNNINNNNDIIFETPNGLIPNDNNISDGNIVITKNGETPDGLL